MFHRCLDTIFDVVTTLKSKNVKLLLIFNNQKITNNTAFTAQMVELLSFFSISAVGSVRSSNQSN